MKHISLFSGIGGFDLASDRMGWTNLASCEIGEFGRKVLKYYWPNAYHHDDIHTLTFEKLDYELKKRFGSDWRTDDIVLTGGFPCQPFSQAGKRKGTEDSRHLWPEMLRAIKDIEPRWIVGENVSGILNWSDGMVFEQVCADLEAAGFKVQTVVLPACGVNAPHRRDRVWFVAKAKCEPITKGNDRREKHIKDDREKVWVEHSTSSEASTDTINERLERRENGCRPKDKRQSERSKELRKLPRQEWQEFPTQPPVCSGNDELSTRLDGITFPKWRRESIKAYGNAIVPAVALQIFKAIEEIEK